MHDMTGLFNEKKLISTIVLKQSMTHSKSKDMTQKLNLLAYLLGLFCLMPTFMKHFCFSLIRAKAVLASLFFFFFCLHCNSILLLFKKFYYYWWHLCYYTCSKVQVLKHQMAILFHIKRPLKGLQGGLSWWILFQNRIIIQGNLQK